LAKLTDAQKQKIIADYVCNQNNCETARMNGVSEFTVRKIVKESDQNELSKKLEEKKLKNTQSTIEYMNEQHETKKRILDKILKAIEIKADDVDLLTNIKDLATAYGIILDKELKVLELQKDNGTINKELSKVEELLQKINDEAQK